MKKTISLIFAVLFLALSTNAQIGWQRYYSFHNFFPGEDISSAWDAIYAIVPDTNGINFVGIAGGCENGTSECSGFMRAKLDNGDILLQKRIVDTVEYSFVQVRVSNGMKKLPDGSFVLIGLLERNGHIAPFMTKLDAEGDIIWFNSYENQSVFSSESSLSVHMTSSGDFILYLSGRMWNETINYLELKKISSEGEQIWTKHFNFPDSVENAVSEDMVVLPSDDILITFSARAAGTNSSRYTWVAKFDAEGDNLWLKRFWREADPWSQIVNTPDGNIVIGASTDMVPNIPGFYFVVISKIDTSGSIIWENTQAWYTMEQRIPITTVCSNGDILSTGDLYGVFPVSGIFVQRISPDGELRWLKGYSVDYIAYGGFLLEAIDIAEAPDGSIVIAGSVDRQPTHDTYAKDGWMLHIDSEGCFYPDSCTQFLNIVTDIRDVGHTPTDQKYLVYPSPASDYLRLDIPNVKGKKELEIFDYSGRSVLRASFEERNAYQVDVSQLPGGLYFLSISKSGRLLYSTKVFIQH